MNVMYLIFAGFMAFSFISCSKMSSGIAPEPTIARYKLDGPPLYLVDNVEVSDLKQMQIIIKSRQNKIKNILVLKPDSPSSSNNLVSVYGFKAKDGVIHIVTK